MESQFSEKKLEEWKDLNYDYWLIVFHTIDQIDKNNFEVLDMELFLFRLYLNVY